MYVILLPKSLLLVVSLFPMLHCYPRKCRGVEWHRLSLRTVARLTRHLTTGQYSRRSRTPIASVHTRPLPDLPLTRPMYSNVKLKAGDMVHKIKFNASQ